MTAAGTRPNEPTRSPIRPLWIVAVGVLVVGVDIRFDGLEALPDTAGFVLLGWGAARLLPMRYVAIAAAGALAAAPQVVLPYHYREVEGLSVNTSGRARVATVEVLEFDRLTGPRLAAEAVAIVLAVAVVASIVVALHERAARWRAQETTRRLGFAGAAVALVWAGPSLVAMLAGVVTGDGYDPVWNGSLWGVQMIGSVATVAFAAAVLSVAREPWALSPGQRLRMGRPDPT